MTPQELQKFVNECELAPSAVAFMAGIDRFRIREFLSGNIESLTETEQASLADRLVVPEEKRVASTEDFSAVLDAIGEFLVRHCIHYHYENQGERNTASGTLVQIGNRLLVATARHTIPRKSQFLEFTGGNTSFVEERKAAGEARSTWKGSSQVRVLSNRRHDVLDVGFLELEPTVLSVLKREAISLGNVSVRTPQYGRLTCVFGYPSEMERKVRIAPNRGAILIPSLTYPKELLAPEEWPCVPAADRQPEENIDCFLTYSRDSAGQMVLPLSQTAVPEAMRISEKLPAVHGMSGGGFWQSWKPVQQDGVWSATGYELLAIQSTWNESEKYIRGIQIRHWLDLIASHFSDLRPAIEQHIHEQSQGN